MILSLLASPSTTAGFEIWAIEETIPEWRALFVDDTLRRQRANLFRQVRAAGPPRNTKLNNVLDSSAGVYELKPGDVRLPYFYAEHRRRAIIVTHGFRKKSQKTPAREIRRAIRALKAYRDARDNGTLEERTEDDLAGR